VTRPVSFCGQNEDLWFSRNAIGPRQDEGWIAALLQPRFNCILLYVLQETRRQRFHTLRFNEADVTGGIGGV
jgi:hypothetical protein